MIRVIVVNDQSDEGGARLGAVLRLTDDHGWWRVMGANLLTTSERVYQLLKVENLSKAEIKRWKSRMRLHPKTTTLPEGVVSVKHAVH